MTVGHDDVIGSTIDRYRIEAPIGTGAAGVVYRATHSVLHRTVAFKLLHAVAEDPERVLARFLTEARAAAAIGSPHIVDVLDGGTTPDGRVFLVMEFLEGEDLQQHMAGRGVVRPRDAVAVTRQVLAGLEAAHLRGVVHRDLKPANIFLASQPGGGLLVKILDFGASKMHADGSPVSLTRTGEQLGAPHYVAPEQYRGARYVDRRADLYSLGVVLYEMLAGRRPFESVGVDALAEVVMSKGAPDIRALAPHVSDALAETIARALRRDPAERFSDARAMREELEAAPVQSMLPPAPAAPAAQAPTPEPEADAKSQGAFAATLPGAAAVRAHEHDATIASGHAATVSAAPIAPVAVQDIAVESIAVQDIAVEDIAVESVAHAATISVAPAALAATVGVVPVPPQAPTPVEAHGKPGLATALGGPQPPRASAPPPGRVGAPRDAQPAPSAAAPTPSRPPPAESLDPWQVGWMDSGRCRATWRNLLIVIERSAPTRKSMVAMSQEARKLASRYPEGIGILELIAPGTPIADQGMRHMAAATLASVDVHTKAVAHLVEGHDAWASASRSVVADVIMFACTSTPHRVFVDMRGAVVWLGPHLDVDPGDIALVLRQILAAYGRVSRT